MNQIVMLLQQSNKRMDRIMQSLDGRNKPDMAVLAAAQKECEAQIKIINSVVSAFAIASKNKRAMTGLNRMNIMDDHTAIDLGLGDPEVDKVKCPLKESLVLRSECLDYSGSHYEECKGCEIGIETKRMLLPE